MTITFKSTTKGQGESNPIEFTAPVVVSQLEDLVVYEFAEPSNNVMNRIEFNDKYVNIFAGPSTINLQLGEKIYNEYVTPQGSIAFDADLLKVETKNNKTNITYELSQVNNPFGKFHIELTLNK